MHIDHVAVWTTDVKRLRDFYIKHFGCHATEMYHNPKKSFTSCFISFNDGARLEIMNKPTVHHSGDGGAGGALPVGLAHFAICVGSEQAVIDLTKKLEASGVRVAGQPRRTGDGSFESVILDVDGNQVEIAA